MIQNKHIAVVVLHTMNNFSSGKSLRLCPITWIASIFVDDQSQDETVQRVQSYLAQSIYTAKVKLIEHEINQGVGAAISTGYMAAAKDKMDVIAVMAGDGQMDPDDLLDILMPVVNDEADYTKGNRLFTGQSWEMIPRYRYLGNAFLSLLTKFASGYWHIADSQTGYTAISVKPSNSSA